MHVSYITCLMSLHAMKGQALLTPFIHKCNAALMHVLLAAQEIRISAASLRSHVLVLLVVVVFHLLHRFFDVR